MYWYGTSKDRSLSESLSLFSTNEDATYFKIYLRLRDDSDAKKRISYRLNNDETVQLSQINNFKFVSSEDVKKKVDNDSFKSFKFDKVFDVTSKQEDIAACAVPEVLNDLLDGYNCSYITYGPKSSGKSYTLFGNDDNAGIAYQLIDQLGLKLQELKNNNDIETTFTLTCVESHLEKVYDLLNSKEYQKPLKMHRSSKHEGDLIENLNSIETANLNDIKQYFDMAITNMSSRHADINCRSNCVFKLKMKQRDYKDDTLISSYLYLIDLAGCDMIEKRSIVGVSSEDTKKLNNSIRSVQHLISILSTASFDDYNAAKSIIDYKMPYNVTRISRLLQDSIGGNCKTTFLLTASVNQEQKDITFSTLDFGLKLKGCANFAQMDKKGLNTKAAYKLLMDNIKHKENNYNKIIQLQKEEKDRLQEQLMDLKKSLWASQLNSKNEENSILKAQVLTLSQLLSNPRTVPTHIGFASPPISPNPNFKKNERNEEVLKTLMEKCSRLAELELELDNKKRDNMVLQKERTEANAKAKALETMNNTLLDRVTNLELHLKDLMNKNGMFQKEVESWSNIAHTETEKNKSFEALVKSNTQTSIKSRSASTASSTFNSLSRVVDSSNVEAQQSSLHKSRTFQNSRNISGASMMSGYTLEHPIEKSTMKGVNLHVLKSENSKKKYNSHL